MPADTLNYNSQKPYLFRAIYEWLLDNEATPLLLVDATHPLVRVPSEHINNGQITLNAHPSAVSQWACDNDAIAFSARFSGVARNIYIPMGALLAVYSREDAVGMAFPEQLEVDMESSALDEDIEPSSAFVQPEVSDEASESNTTAPLKQTDNKRSHLKIIK